jgi:hypothetical protein
MVVISSSLSGLSGLSSSAGAATSSVETTARYGQTKVKISMSLKDDDAS